MGRSSIFICENCKEVHYLGYGCYSSWLDDCKTVDEFESKPSEDKEVPKNQRFLALLKSHEKCDWQTYNGDDIIITDQNIMREGYGYNEYPEEIVENLSEYKMIGFEEDE